VPATRSATRALVPSRFVVESDQKRPEFVVLIDDSWVGGGPWRSSSPQATAPATNRPVHHHNTWCSRRSRRAAAAPASARVADDLATAARLLDIGFFRIGGEVYAQEKGSHGLVTVLRSHVGLGRGGTVEFDYPAKSGPETRAIKEVAEYLGNTPAIARSAYVDPAVIEAFEQGVTIRPTLERLGTDDVLVGEQDRERVERVVLDLLRD
jgi:hypothetical protein